MLGPADEPWPPEADSSLSLATSGRGAPGALRGGVQEGHEGAAVGGLSPKRARSLVRGGDSAASNYGSHRPPTDAKARSAPSPTPYTYTLNPKP